MNPIQHGEVFVTDDGTETDLDLGHYERFIDENLDKNSNVITGKIYWSVLQKERHGDYGGGTVGDIESQPFLESIRQFQHEVGHENAILIHVTLILYLRASQEMKTRPTQASVKELQGMGIRPDIIVCRSEYPLDEAIKDKISLFCNVPKSHVLQNLDVEYLYEAPLAMETEHLADVACEYLRFPCPPRISGTGLPWWKICGSDPVSVSSRKTPKPTLSTAKKTLRSTTATATRSTTLSGKF